jgi:hypothetical protein
MTRSIGSLLIKRQKNDTPELSVSTKTYTEKAKEP